MSSVALVKFCKVWPNNPNDVKLEDYKLTSSVALEIMSGDRFHRDVGLVTGNSQWRLLTIGIKWQEKESMSHNLWFPSNIAEQAIRTEGVFRERSSLVEIYSSKTSKMPPCVWLAVISGHRHATCKNIHLYTFHGQKSWIAHYLGVQKMATAT